MVNLVELIDEIESIRAEINERQKLLEAAARRFHDAIKFVDLQPAEIYSVGPYSMAIDGNYSTPSFRYQFKRIHALPETLGDPLPAVMPMPETAPADAFL